jgi:predicted Rossmann-fold nucleotide-binding protein
LKDKSFPLCLISGLFLLSAKQARLELFGACHISAWIKSKLSVSIAARLRLQPPLVEAALALGRFCREQYPARLWRRVGRADGAIAKSTLDHGGSVTGIIPDFCDPRTYADARSEMIVTPDMHERKR